MIVAWLGGQEIGVAAGRRYNILPPPCSVPGPSLLITVNVHRRGSLDLGTRALETKLGQKGDARGEAGALACVTTHHFFSFFSPLHVAQLSFVCWMTFSSPSRRSSRKYPPFCC